MTRAPVLLAALLLSAPAFARGPDTAITALAAPEGVTFQTTRPVFGMGLPPGGGQQSRPAPPQAVYADAAGLTLYTYDKDTTGASTCTDACAETWHPFTAPADAKPFGDWWLIPRGKTKQWGFKGRALYTHARDARPGDAKGDKVDNAWHALAFQPAAGVALPFGISLQEVAEASGQVLVDARGMPLYAFTGKLEKDVVACKTGCGRFVPVAAAGLANAVGDFAAVRRPDGVRQWAYKARRFTPTTATWNWATPTARISTRATVLPSW